MGVRYAKIGDRVIGRDTVYLIVEFIGEGGMAQVFKAVETDSGLEVVVKIMKRESHEKADTYRQEFLVLRGLMHPYIVKLYDFIDTDEYVYIVMEYLPGGSLKRRIGSSNRMRLIEDVIKIAHAIDFAHANGIIHRDIKPANVLYDDKGEPRITDFGIAIHMFSHSVTGRYAGTPAYMAPEQIKGESLDPRTDIYQLGLLLYEIMTGHLPFEPDNSSEFMQWIDKGLTKEPSLFEKNIPPAFDEVFIKSLSARRENRYKRALDFAVEVVNACKRSGFNISDNVMSLFKDVMARVVIDVKPDESIVYIEDEYVGLSPVIIEEIFPGSKHLKIKKPLFEKINTWTWLDPGETTYLDFELYPDDKGRVGPVRFIRPVVDSVTTVFGLYILGTDVLAHISLDSTLRIIDEITIPGSKEKKMYPVGDILALIGKDEILYVDMPRFHLYHTGIYTRDLTKVIPGNEDTVAAILPMKLYWIRKGGEVKTFKGHYENAAPGANVIALYDGSYIYIMTPYEERARIKVSSWIRGIYILDKLGILMIDYVNHLSFVTFDGRLIEQVPNPFRQPILDVMHIRGGSYIVVSSKKVGVLVFDERTFHFAQRPVPLPSGTYKVVLSDLITVGPIIITRNRRILVLDIFGNTPYTYEIDRLPGGFATVVKDIRINGPYLTVTLNNDNTFVHNIMSWQLA